MLEFVNIKFRAVTSSWVDLNLKPLMSLIFSLCDHFCQFSSSSFVILEVTTRWRVFVFILLVNVKGVTVHHPRSWCCLCEFCEFVCLLKFISNPQISTRSTFPVSQMWAERQRLWRCWPDTRVSGCAPNGTALPWASGAAAAIACPPRVCPGLRQRFCTSCWWCQYLKRPPSVVLKCWLVFLRSRRPWSVSCRESKCSK